MSLLPPTPATKSKIKYMMKEKLTPDLYDKVIKATSPYYLFRLYARFRYLDGTPDHVYNQDEIVKLTGNTSTEWDCIDTALNMHTRLKERLHGDYRAKAISGYLRVCIQTIDDSYPLGSEWSDMFTDEYPVIVKGVYKTEDIDIEKKTPLINELRS